MRRLTPEETEKSYHAERDRMRDYYRHRGRPDKTAEHERERARRQGNLLRKQVARLVYQAIKDGRLKKPDHCPVCGFGDRRIIAKHPKGYEEPLTVRWICCVCDGMAARKGPPKDFRGPELWKKVKQRRKLNESR